MAEATTLSAATAPPGVAPLRGAQRLAVLSTGSPTLHTEIMAAGRRIGTVRSAPRSRVCARATLA